MMQCRLCDNPIRGKKHQVLYRVGENLVHGYVCERCWNQHYNVVEAIVAKNRKKGKCMDIRPCEKCGRTDFGSDQARRAHQGRCQGKVSAEGTKTKRFRTDKPNKANKPKKGPPELKPPEKDNDLLGKVFPKPLAKCAPPPGCGPQADKYAEAPIGDPQEAHEEPKGKRKISKAGCKTKGNDFENDVKKMLARWWGEPEDTVGTKESKFQRAPGSGATSTTNWPLDLSVPPDFPWAVECKNREGTKGWEEMERFFSAEKYGLIEWFRVAEEQLVEAKIEKPLLLVFTKNFFPDMVALRRPRAGEQHILFRIPHMTLCHQQFGEIVVADAVNFLGFEFKNVETVKAIYAAADKDSYMPRRWKERS